MDSSDLVKGLGKAGAGVVTVLYFARLREALGRDSEELALSPDIGTVGALRDSLRARGGAWETQFAEAKPVRADVNQTMASLDTTIAPGDEIAFFPPVTGG